MVLKLVFVTCSEAQKRWDGEGKDSLWHNPLNWYPNGVPGIADDVKIDNSLLPGKLWVSLGNDTVHVNSISISSDGEQHTLLIPQVNTRMPVIRLESANTSLDIGQHTLLLNRSGAPAGNPIEMNGKLAIRNGGSYVHNTSRGNAYLAGKLLSDSSTSKGKFIFDVPGTSGYTVSLTGRTYGTLQFTSSTGRKSYSGTGSNDLTVHGDLIIDDSASLTTTLTARIILGGSIYVNGRLNFNPVTADSTGRLIELTGDTGSLKIQGLLETGANFRGFELTSGQTTMQSDLQLSPGAFFLVKSGGKLNMDTFSIRGGGHFKTDSHTQIFMAHQTPIPAIHQDGNIMTSLISLHKKSGITLAGINSQSTGIRFPDTLGQLSIHKPLGECRLSKPLHVTDSLVLQKGILFVADTTGLTLSGIFREGNVQSYISGPVMLEMNNKTTVSIPIGDSLVFAPVSLTATRPFSNPLLVRFSRDSIPASDNNLRFPLKSLAKKGYWTINLLNAATPYSDSCSIQATIFDSATKGFTSLPFLAVKSADSSHWTLAILQINRENNTLSTPQMPLGSSTWTIAELYPVALSQQAIRLKSTTTDNSPALSWEVTDTDNISEFQIERSANGREFKLMETVEAYKNKQVYNFLISDQAQLSNRRFFRIRGISFNQTEIISNIVYFDFKEDDNIFPNPATDILFIGLRQKEIREIRLVDASGASKPINSSDYGDKTGFWISHLPAGIYRLHLLRNGKWKVLSFVRK